MGFRTIEGVAKRISYSVVLFVSTMMCGVFLSEPMWVWINGDEEEDTVRFRQRLTFTVFWFVVLGLIQLKNSVRS